jgi:TetR/AcrR family transcriptional regulator of autoinduction and epiphytic fitness
VGAGGDTTTTFATPARAVKQALDKVVQICQFHSIVSDATDSPAPADDPRRRKLLDAALTVFLRFGFRKTSMDEVARAANVSRQGLYLHFSTKEELFRAAVRHVFDGALAEASASLADAALPLDKRLTGAFDAWVGRFVGMPSGNAADLAAAAGELVGPLAAEREAMFVEVVAKAVRASGLMAAYKPKGITARQIAEMLHATARGLKYSATRAAFLEGMSVAARVVCLPLREGSGK